jgi:hypothetical protein
MVPPLIVRTPDAMKGADETIEPEPFFVMPVPLVRELPARLIDVLPSPWIVPTVGGVNICMPVATGTGIGPRTSPLFGPNKLSVLLTSVTRFVIWVLPDVIADGGICALWITPAEPRGLLLRVRLPPITVGSPVAMFGIEI